jgi:hypothetical protein
MFLSRLKNKFRVFSIFSCTCWASYSKALFGVKTELDLNGLDVVKESAEILAKAVETFPTKNMAIAIIGFIAVSQGLYFFAKGLATFICGDSYRPTDGKRAGSLYGLILCFIGIGLASAGALASLYSAALTQYFFGA